MSVCSHSDPNSVRSAAEMRVCSSWSVWSAVGEAGGRRWEVCAKKQIRGREVEGEPAEASGSERIGTWIL